MSTGKKVTYYENHPVAAEQPPGGCGQRPGQIPATLGVTACYWGEQRSSSANTTFGGFQRFHPIYETVSGHGLQHLAEARWSSGPGRGYFPGRVFEGLRAF